ncbi:DNA topoisomerase I, partial [Candidatus Bathyarchaeota archaeon]|nr:DNA topoisomerase I [Candidatus Bathyarchaeota archaeon]
MRTLIICEKPDAAARVAKALDDDGDPRRIETGGVPLFESRRRSETIFVCSALGHLYAVSGKSSGSRRYYPVWDYGWKPKNLVDKQSARLARWIQAINAVSKKTDRFVNACDYDVEGSLIGYTVLRYACEQAHEKAARMKFSTMTERELQNAYSALSPELDFSQADAGQCRHELDWLYGINLTRLLTESSLRQNRGYLTLSTGRVQGPTLKFVVDREEEVQCFTPTPFWTIDASISHDGNSCELEYEKEKILVRAQALRIVSDCTNALLSVVDKESRSIHQSPPFPFDLSTLQGEAYRHFGFSPSRTLALAERLYLDAIISYPRTSSQKLPPDIGYAEILRGVAHNHQYGQLANELANRTSLRPNNGPKSDPAHPAIYPTGEAPKRSLIQPEANLLDLIIRRFMATFAEPSLREATRITLAKEPHKFFLRGSRLLSEGWVEYYRPYIIDESKELPNLNKGDQARVQNIETVEKFTDPPPRYNPSSLLRKMEDENIGTKATRAEIVEILYRRGYIKETRIEATPLAVKVISILDKYCPLITDIGFTARLESQMEKIQSGQATRLGILTEALEHLRPVILDLISKETEIGAQLSEVIVSQRLSDTTFTTPCPSCNSLLRVIRSRASGKRFIGCQGYQKGCRFTLPLPQFGTLSLTRNKCKNCGFQLVSVKSKARRPLTSCPRCYAIRMKER